MISRLSLCIIIILLAWPSLCEPYEAPFYLHDVDGKPLRGVRVSVVGRSGSATTAVDGSFRFDFRPIPPFTIVVFDHGGRLLGKVAVETMDRGRPVQLTVEPLNVESIRVVSGTAPTTIAPPAGAATTISREEQQRQRPVRLVDAVETVPGVSRSGSGQTAVPAIRGLASGRTLIILDDARVTAERRVGPSATYLDPFSLENVEIVRGPGSVAYGSDALGGVIHARTPEPRTGEREGRFELAAGSGEDLASAALELNQPLGNGAMLLQVHQRYFGGYDSPEGPEPNSYARDRGLLVRTLVPAGRTKLLIGLQSDRGSDIARPRNDTSRKRTIYPAEDSDRLTVSADIQGRAGFERFELRAFAGRYRLATETVTLDTGETGTSDVDADDASFRILAYGHIGRASLRSGVDLSGRFGLHAADGDTVTVDSARRIDAGIFTELDRPLGTSGTSVAAGLRGDRVSTSNRGGLFGDRSTSDSAFSGYAAARHKPAGSRFEFSLQASAGFRAPRLSDMYFAGTTARGRITGNPDLEPETSRQFDLAVRTGAGRADLAIYAYLYRISDLIERYETEIEDEFRFRNRGEEEVRGLELEGDMPLGDRLSLRVTADWSRGEILDDGSYPSDIPPATFRLTLNHRPAERLWYRVTGLLAAGDDRPGPTEAATPGYARFDAATGLAITENLEARLLLRNLTDRSYPASADSRAPLAPGRSAVVVLSGSF